MNKFQKRYHRKQSQAAAVGYIPAADCIGKEFSGGQYIYRVVQHHPHKGTFTCAMVNYFDNKIELDETYVRHHCTPVSGVISASIVQNEDIEHQPVDDKMTLTVDFHPTTETTPVPLPCEAGKGLGDGDKDPTYYLDQIFSFESGGTTFTVTVQAYNERRKQFRLYDIRPEARSGSFYRDAAFVYQHCQPADKPVLREPRPQPTFDPFRFWNLVSLVDKRQIIAERVQQTGAPAADPLLQCACCEQPVTIIGKQIWSAKMKHKESILVECQNPDCITYRRTATPASHAQICDDAKREKGESA